MLLGSRILVTGGAGFIGSALIRYLITSTSYKVINLDKLTYAGNMDSLADIAEDPRYTFELADIADRESVIRILEQHRPDAIINLAAESHVDRSIDTPGNFVQTNIVGTYVLLEESLRYLSQLSEYERSSFRFHHVSTDEVYGDLGTGDNPFTEASPYAPSSPYSATKASSDHLVRAWHRTFGLPVLISNCSNNYGPYQFPEKLIPLMVLNAINGKPLPVYGTGENIRDWLYVEDHAKALIRILEMGRLGETYNISGYCERCNIDVVNTICELLEELAPSKPAGLNCYKDLITYVTDRPGHDVRYSMDATKLESELGWLPGETFESGLRKTVQWYLENADWCQRIQNGSYQGQRLGLIG